MAQKKKETAKKTTAKKAPAKTPATKASAKKTPAKKTSAKKAAKKTPAVAPAETTTIALPGGVELAMVRIPEKDYWMGKFEVTQAQWEAVTGTNPSKSKGAKNPVDQVMWKDCQLFLKKLNAQPAANASGLVFRLPTEEEWVFAARAGATGDYCKLADGTEITEETLGEVAWFYDNSDETMHPVGQKLPNAFGLYDMFGNVKEWTATAKGKNRVCRGGCFDEEAGECEASYPSRTENSLLIFISPEERSWGLGFRLCADRKAD